MSASRGFPDFSRYVEQEAAPFINNVNEQFTTSLSVAAEEVSRWRNLYLAYTGVGFATRVVAAWSSPNDVGQQVGVREFHLNDGDTLRWFTPHLGPFFFLSVDAPASGNVVTYSLLGAHTDRPPGVATPVRNDVLASIHGQLVNAGATLIDEWDVPYVGPAHISVDSDAADWRVEIRGRNYQGTEVRLAAFDERNTPVVNHILYVPRMRMRTFLINNDAAARVFNVYVTPLAE